MGIYRGTAPLKAYKGDMQPVNVYKGSTKVAGWHSASYSGTSPLTVDCDYNVAPDALTITGRCVQTGTPSPDSHAPISTITGDVTITGADGAASDTATVAFGSAVCASLPDGTHDTYDAVTGVLTKKVGKVVEASGTSWAIANAASGSSIISDCFGADVLSGTGFSAYDAVCQPNLTPFFSHSLTDSSYWMYIDTEHITQLTDGWAHIAYDNSARASNKYYIDAFVAPQSFVVGGKVYTTMVEIRNTTGATATGLYALSRDGSVTQLVGATLPGIIPVKDGVYYFHKQTPNTNLIKGSNISVSADSTLNGGDKSSPVYDIDFDVINAHLGEKVTLSADFKLVNAVASATSQARCGVEPSSPGYAWEIGCWEKISVDSQNPTNFDGRISFTGTLPTTAFTQNVQPNLYIQGLTAGTCVVSNPKLELGSVATAYSPAAGELSTFTGGLNRSFAGIAPGENVSFDMRLSLYEGDYNGAYKPYALPCAPTVYYRLATPTTIQLVPHLPVVRTGIKALSVGADVVPTLSATVKSMD